jgi:hypothetical protein
VVEWLGMEEAIRATLETIAIKPKPGDFNTSGSIN